MPFLEVACFNEASAKAACDAGASRIELCLNQEVGGTTPSQDMCKRVAEHAASASVPVNIMIRPRGGDFVYSDEEFAAMASDLQQLRGYASAFIFGVLTDGAEIDVERTARLVQLAHPLPCTFHRAFDQCLDMTRAVRDVVHTGCTAILSAGCQTDAHQGLSQLANLQQLSKDNDLTLIVGGGLRSTNARTIHSVVNAQWYHSSALLNGSSVANYDEICDIMAALH